jgi:hypothetical protein
MGAPDPRKEAKADAKLSGLTQKARAHWAYQPVKKPAHPRGEKPRLVSRQSNAFILQKIEEKGMAPLSAADPETLLRRATYGLIGLPPTPQEVSGISERPVAARLCQGGRSIARLTSLRRKMGTLLAGYGALCRHHRRPREQHEQRLSLPLCWTYRDYVVRAFNETSLTIVSSSSSSRLTSSRISRIHGIWQRWLPHGRRTFWESNDVINDRIDAVSKGFLGMTVTCARCHDHMFDPISTKDYYALHGVFASTVEPKEMPVIISGDRQGRGRGIRAEDRYLRAGESGYLLQARRRGECAL